MIALLMDHDTEVAQIQVEVELREIHMCSQMPRTWTPGDPLELPPVIDLYFDLDEFETDVARMTHQRSDIAVYRRRA